MQQSHKAQHSVAIPIVELSHEKIANRAYEIYVEKGYQQNQSEENWLQSEQELKSQRNWRQVEKK